MITIHLDHDLLTIIIQSMKKVGHMWPFRKKSLTRLIRFQFLALNFKIKSKLFFVYYVY